MTTKKELSPDAHNPAFPEGEDGTCGLTKREAFAMHALAGAMAREDAPDYTPEGLAIRAQEAADALLLRLWETRQ